MSEKLYKSVPVEPSEKMCDAARGVMQLLRSTTGTTYTMLREHCESRGDDMTQWPAWALSADTYVTESGAAALVYALMTAAAPPVVHAPEQFDAWMQNPYTKVLMKSMDEDYVPRVDAERAEAAAEATHKTNVELVLQNEEKRKEIEALRADAMRYRYTRREAIRTGVVTASEAEYDAAIDRGIKDEYAALKDRS